jgi:hypothetical protein
LFFLRSLGDVGSIESELRRHWIEALRSVGLDGNEHSLSFQGGDAADKYIVKMSQELSLSHVKRGRTDVHFSPFQMLQTLEDGSCGDLSVELLSAFREYAVSIKGKNQMNFSRAFRDNLVVSFSESDSEAFDESFSKLFDAFTFTGYRRLDDLAPTYIQHLWERGLPDEVFAYLAAQGCVVVECVESLLPFVVRYFPSVTVIRGDPGG